ncbi:MAG: bifunctional 4-hydroxy-2-oxoglutarate aldolase/2-dehydro-3-deoxy-phosphogluconate aldolase [Oscillospiraceae bacterium]|nr:bifunctional 4-hydroxy-2-oxoglutarate aldolase/2-dehydro-3-deoxy-phosphogluconate aldolase [Oscillospiraceae bacterium]
MDVLKRIGLCGVVPVVVIEDAKDAVPTAKALLAGGVDIMEITFRTAAALDAIRAVAEACPEMCVGAGTVLSLEQGKAAVEGGAKFLVSPGFNSSLVGWCVENDVAVTPGCVTPTEITEALSMGLEVLKFFPANIYGGLDAMKALAAPFGKVKFIPTGGVSDKNLAEYMGVPYIHAVGGSWLCAKADITAGRFDKITELCRKARQVSLGYEIAHVGINCDSSEASAAVCSQFEKAFGFETKTGNSSNFSSSAIEVMKENYLGANGHLAIRTSNLDRAVADLERKGFTVAPETAKYKGNTVIAVYLKEEFGGFAVHLLQK